MKRLFLLLALSTIMVGCGDNKTFTLSSNESDMIVTLECTEDGALTFELQNEERVILSKSPISFEIDEQPIKWELLKKRKESVDKIFPMAYGEFSEVIGTYTDMICEVRLITDTKSIDGTITVRLFESAMAYRVTLNDVAEQTTLLETSGWVPADLSGGCYSSNGEYEPLGAMAISQTYKQHRTPVVYECTDQFLALHECDLFDYPQLFITGYEDGSALGINIEGVNIEGDVELPWRVVMVGKSWQDLHNQKSIYQTMSREAEGDFSWVKPGLCMWDWRVKGTTFDGFTYKMDTKSLKRYIDFCSKSNISYFLIDDEWCEEHNPLQPVEGLDLREVVAYGKEKGVGIILYYDMTYVDKDHPAIDFDIIAAAYEDFGVAGMKYGFLKGLSFKDETTMTQDIIKTAAKHKMIVNFHDSPIPFSGLERTFPNYVNREYCHAQLDRRSAFNPRQFVKMACVNLLAGHMDQTNGTYALNEMATRSKGPRNEYLSTVSAETARFLFTHTGAFSVLIDAPEAYEQKADLFKVISSLPAKWDETKYLEMEFRSHVSVAKRTGDRWFAAVVYNECGDAHTLELDFLEPSTTYTATIYSDAEDTDFRTNKEAYAISTQTVTAKDVIEVTVPDGGGYSVIFDKQ